jgi:hypothetical protein
VKIGGYFNGSFYLNREKREMSRKGKDRFRVFWRFVRLSLRSVRGSK